MNKKTLLTFLSTTILVLPTVTSAAPCEAFPSGGKAYTILLQIQTTLIGISATVAVIGWCVAGYLYLTSGGGERMGTAKKALIAAVIGTALLAIASSAQQIICSFLPSTL